jgi:hypothetical protein
MKYLIRLADLSKVNLDDDAIQYITDSMANSMLIKIEYENSGWRTVQPYGWNNSKDNNLLIMCYKQDGSVRSYRWDRIIQLFIDDSLMNPETGNDLQELNEDNKSNPEDYIIPYLPETEEILELSESEEGEDDPFNEAVETLSDGLDDETNYVAEHEEELKDKINDKQKDENELNDDVDFNLDNDNELNNENEEEGSSEDEEKKSKSNE